MLNIPPPNISEQKETTCRTGDTGMKADFSIDVEGSILIVAVKKKKGRKNGNFVTFEKDTATLHSNVIYVAG